MGLVGPALPVLVSRRCLTPVSQAVDGATNIVHGATDSSPNKRRMSSTAILRLR
jgi:hypothetical protein